MKKNTGVVRTTVYASKKAVENMIIINEKRNDLGKCSLSKSEVIALSIINFDLQKGIDHDKL